MGVVVCCTQKGGTLACVFAVSFWLGSSMPSWYPGSWYTCAVYALTMLARCAWLLQVATLIHGLFVLLWSDASHQELGGQQEHAVMKHANIRMTIAKKKYSCDHPPWQPHFSKRPRTQELQKAY